MFPALLIAIVLGSGGYSAKQKQPVEVDVIELNHFSDPVTGKYCFSQVIGWVWSHDYNRLNIAGWYLYEDLRNAPGWTPRGWTGSNHKRGSEWKVFRAEHFRETWTIHDPEKENRELNKGVR